MARAIFPQSHLTLSLVLLESDTISQNSDNVKFFDIIAYRFVGL
jgi:hypothetical protein